MHLREWTLSWEKKDYILSDSALPHQSWTAHFQVPYVFRKNHLSPCMLIPQQQALATSSWCTCQMDFTYRSVTGECDLGWEWGSRRVGHRHLPICSSECSMPLIPYSQEPPNCSLALSLILYSQEPPKCSLDSPFTVWCLLLISVLSCLE